MPELAHKKRANRAKSRKANPEMWAERYRRQNLRQNLRQNFGMTIEDYDNLLDSQNGCCAICERHESKFNTRLAVDHDHNTGKVRGLLCSSCNTGIGLLQDDPEYVEAALIYLKGGRY